MLEALEEQVVLLRLLDRSGATSQIVVRIGNENNHEGLLATSVVTRIKAVVSNSGSVIRVPPGTRSG